MKHLLCTLCLAALAFFIGIAPAHATVVIAGTRVVFPAAAGETTVRLTNQGAQPALVEAWIDDGDASATPETAKVPFLITPPLARMNAGKGQSLRIVFTGKALPGDRESLYWLNVLEIPPKPKQTPGDAQNTLQFAIRSRLKLLYRPANLAGNPLTAGQQLSFKAVADGPGYALEVRNPTPYYVTINTLTVHAGSATDTAASGMVAPMGTLRLPLKATHAAPAAGSVVDYAIINDYGASSSFKGTVAP